MSKRYVSAHPASWTRVTSKTELKEAAKEGFNAEMNVVDPLGIGVGIMGLNEIPDDIILVVTNHPKRSWFANVEKKNGKVVVS